MRYLLSFICALGLWLIPAVTLAQSPVTVITTTIQAEPGFIFTTPGSIFAPDHELMILDSRGTTIYSQPAPAGYDFRRQGAALSWSNADPPEFLVLDDNYNTIKTFHAVGPDPADLHEFILLPGGGALFLVYRSRTVDMTSFGGPPDATVFSCVVQEVDADNNLVFEWDGWGVNPLSDTVVSLIESAVDYDHCNAAEVDSDGNILVSHRNLNQVTKIDRQTGAVIWKLGGVSNEFTFANDPGFALQHDIRRLPSGHITLFDNGTSERGYSRAVEYDIAEAARVITRTWEYRGPFAFCCGNAQRLPGGNTFVNWGPAHPTITEVTPDGGIVWAADMLFAYRSYKFSWFVRLWLPVVGK